MPNRTIAKSGGGDFTTFDAARAAAGTLETFDVIEAGVYTETGTLTITKSMAFINTSGGDVTITQAAAANVNVNSGSACVVEFTDIDFDLNPASAVHYNIGLLGAGAHTLKCTRSKFTTEHLSNDCLPVYHATGKSHELVDCELDGHYQWALYSDGAFVNSTVNKLTITQAPISGIFRANHVSKCVENASWQGIVGPAPQIVANANAGRDIFDCGTSGLFTASIVHGLTAVSAFGTGPWVIEKLTLQGSGTYALQAGAAGVAFAGTFRDIGFVDFSSGGIDQPDAAVPGMIDYCGRWNCPAICSKAGSVGTHIQTGDPLFIDEADHNFRIESSSPWLDAGTACVAIVDPDGVAIPQDVYPDIGGFERVYIPPTPVLGGVDNSLRLTTNFAGVPHVDSDYEIVPVDGSGTLTDIRHLLMMWAGTDKYVPTQELPADVRDAEWPDNRGWMADKTAGNRMWLFDRRPLSTQVDTEMQLMLTEDLLWLTQDGIAASYTVTVTHTGRRRNVEIQVKRLDGQLEKYGVADLWENRVIT